MSLIDTLLDILQPPNLESILRECLICTERIQTIDTPFCKCYDVAVFSGGGVPLVPADRLVCEKWVIFGTGVGSTWRCFCGSLPVGSDRRKIT